MMIPHLLITAINMRRNNIFVSCDCITLQVRSYLVNALCFAHPTVRFILSLNLFLPQITPHSCLTAEHNSKQPLQQNIR